MSTTIYNHMHNALGEAMAAIHTRAETIDHGKNLLVLRETIDQAAKMVARRTQNLHLVAQQYRFIPLGEDCFGRSILHQLGYKQSKAEGELSYPFDLSVTPCLSASQLIASNFSYFMDPRYLVWKDGHPAHGRYRIEFNHEQGEYFREHNYKRLRERYAKRILNLRNTISGGHPIVFVVHNFHAKQSIPGAQLAHLAGSVTEHIKTKAKRIVYIDTSGSQSDGIYGVDETLTQIRAAAPEEYTWYNNSDRYSIRGLEFALKLDNLLGSYLRQ
jgi:hypothetical protein